MVNSLDPDETACYWSSHLNLHCLQRSVLVFRHGRVKASFKIVVGWYRVKVHKISKQESVFTIINGTEIVSLEPYKSILIYVRPNGLVLIFFFFSLSLVLLLISLYSY